MPTPTVRPHAVPRPPWGPLESQVVSACRTARWDQALEGLNGGASAQARDSMGFTLLHHTAYHAAGASPERYNGLEPWLDALIAQGAKLNARSKDGETPIKIAADQDAWDLVQALALRGATPNPAPASNGDDGSVLAKAVRAASLETVRTLLDHGADPREEDLLGALMDVWRDDASLTRHRAVFDLLIERGASPLGALKTGLPEEPWHAPLLRALNPESCTGLPLLLAHGALREDPRWAGRDARHALMGEAVEHGCAESVTALLADGVARDFDQAVWDGLLRRMAVGKRTVVARTLHGLARAASPDDQAQRDALRAVIEQAALSHAMNTLPTDAAAPRTRL